MKKYFYQNNLFLSYLSLFFFQTGYYWTMRFLHDNKFKFLSDVERKLITEKILKLGEFIAEAVEILQQGNSGMLLDSKKRLIFLEMKMFVLDDGVKIAVLVRNRENCILW